MTGAGISTGKCWVSFKWKVWLSRVAITTIPKKIFNLKIAHAHMYVTENRLHLDSYAVVFFIFALFKLIVVFFLLAYLIICLLPIHYN